MIFRKYQGGVLACPRLISKVPETTLGRIRIRESKGNYLLRLIAAKYCPNRGEVLH
jgi:hypothetical protein